MVRLFFAIGFVLGSAFSGGAVAADPSLTNPGTVYLNWSRDHLPWLVGAGLRSKRLTGEAYRFSDRIRAQVPAELRAELQPVQAPDSDFAEAGPHRAVVTGQFPGSKIRYLLSACENLDLSTGMGLYFHEIGHHLGELDDPTRRLDRWSSDWVSALGVRQESLSIFGAEGLYVDSLDLRFLDQSTPWEWTRATLTGMGSHLFLRDNRSVLILRDLVLADPAFQNRQLIETRIWIDQGRMDWSKSELQLGLGVQAWTVPTADLPQSAYLHVPVRSTAAGRIEIDWTRTPRFGFGLAPVPGPVPPPASDDEEAEWAERKTEVLKSLRRMVDQVIPLVFTREKEPIIEEPYANRTVVTFFVVFDSPKRVDNINLIFGGPSGIPGTAAMADPVGTSRVAKPANGASIRDNAYWCEPLEAGAERCHLRASVGLKGKPPRFVELIEVRVFWSDDYDRRAGSAQGRRAERLVLGMNQSSTTSVVDAEWVRNCTGAPLGTIIYSLGTQGCASMPSFLSRSSHTSLRLDYPLFGRVEVITEPRVHYPYVGLPIEWRNHLKAYPLENGDLAIVPVSPWRQGYLTDRSIKLKVVELIHLPISDSHFPGTIVLPERIRLSQPLWLELWR